MTIRNQSIEALSNMISDNQVELDLLFLGKENAFERWLESQLLELEKRFADHSTPNSLRLSFYRSQCRVG